MCKSRMVCSVISLLHVRVLEPCIKDEAVVRIIQHASSRFMYYLMQFAVENRRGGYLLSFLYAILFVNRLVIIQIKEKVCYRLVTRQTNCPSINGNVFEGFLMIDGSML